MPSSSTPVALITGISGQDGSYLAEFLLERGYEVHGIIRRSRNVDARHASWFKNVQVGQEKRLFFHYAELNDTTTLRRIIHNVKPSEFYHFAGQSDVALSFEIPETTCQLTASATLSIMEILRDLPDPPRFLHASSREIFGTPAESPQDETTRMDPNSPYGCAKAFATQLVKVYRESQGLFFCNAICFNHESPRRSENFVTRKISLAAARIKAGIQQYVTLGDLNSSRDWGYSKDFVFAMWLMLQQPTPQDFVLATGVSHTVRDFLQLSFERVGLDWNEHVRVDESHCRRVDPYRLLGNSTKAKTELGWAPSVTFEGLVHLMVDHDVEMVQRQTSIQPRADFGS